MDAIILLLGLIIGIAIFACIMDRITAIIYSCQSVVFTFVFCWVIGIVLAWIAWRIALIVGVIALIGFILSKMFGGEPTDKTSENKEQESEKSEIDD